MGGPSSTPKMSEIRRLSFRFFSSRNLTSTLEPNWVTAVGSSPVVTAIEG